jgi:hypothetical protein
MKLQKIAEQAKRHPEMVFNDVLHVIDPAFLLEAYRQTRKRSAPGVNKVTAKLYADNLDDNLRDLHERLRDKWYTWQLQEARSCLRAYRACVAILAKQAQPQGLHTLAEVCRFRPSHTAASETQDHAPHLEEAGTAKLCAKRGVACLVSHERKLLGSRGTR